ncbi:uncharacterized protein LOC135399748 [Ornithodoros turicata]|uniref:uncharacterized protein LOC135399748 n=1 Tax=Ornithodoros turicata TaxID=34597 RepID=UPI003138D913
MEDVFDVSGLVSQWAALLGNICGVPPQSRTHLTATSTDNIIAGLRDASPSERLQECLEELQWRAQVIQELGFDGITVAALRDHAQGFSDSLFAKGITGIRILFLLLTVVRHVVYDWILSHRRQDSPAEALETQYADELRGSEQEESIYVESLSETSSELWLSDELSDGMVQ